MCVVIMSFAIVYACPPMLPFLAHVSVKLTTRAQKKKHRRGDRGTWFVRFVILMPFYPTKVLSWLWRQMLSSYQKLQQTKAGQCEFQRNIRFDRYDAFWSMPVCSKFSTTDDRFSLRGESLGTAVLTNLPHRKMRGNFPDELYSTCRVACGVIRIAGIDVLTVSIYGYAKKCLEGRKLNDLLLARIYDLVTTAKMPFIIGGDMNEPPHQAPIICIV